MSFGSKSFITNRENISIDSDFKKLRFNFVNIENYSIDHLNKSQYYLRENIESEYKQIFSLCNY
jgi:hypothetical protein